MATKINCLDRPSGSRLPDRRMSGAAWQGLPEALSTDRYAGYEAALEQGLRLNRAFIAISDPRVRQAIINLVIEAADGEEARRPSTSHSPEARTRPN
jgi:hypothetical protein